MPTRFVNITLQEMQSFLKEEKGWVVSDCDGYEYAFDWHLTEYSDCIIRVMTSINKHNNMSRGKGKDAIRVFAFILPSDRKKVEGLVKSVKVLRTVNWRTNLYNACVDVIKIARKRIYNRTCGLARPGK